MATAPIVHSEIQQRRKMALVIGVSDYEKGNKLPNTVNDAREMSTTLKTIGFLIHGKEPKLNLTYDEMHAALAAFLRSIKAGDMVLFYFAGHGKQWEDQNYLIPVDNVKDEEINGVTEKVALDGPDLKFHAINAQHLLNDIASRNPFVTVFLLDCCRSYHLRNKNLRTRDDFEEDNQQQGLKSMCAKAGSLIAFACAPGSTASDGKIGETHGLFTKHLLKHMRIPNDDIRMILTDVTNGVMEESNSDQIPHVTFILRQRNICLYEKPPGKQ